MSQSEAGGLKEVIASIRGKNIYSTLKYESGVHRVQRVPDTETQGRIHTSAATVAVLPEAEEVDIKINDSDLRIDVFRAGGGGGGGGGGANGGDDDKGGGDDCPLVLVGGILAEGGIVATRLASMLREHRTGYILQTSPATASDFARVRLVHPKVGPETGAAYVACRMISGDDWKPR